MPQVCESPDLLYCIRSCVALSSRAHHALFSVFIGHQTTIRAPKFDNLELHCRPPTQKELKEHQEEQRAAAADAAVASAGKSGKRARASATTSTRASARAAAASASASAAVVGVPDQEEEQLLPRGHILQGFGVCCSCSCDLVSLLFVFCSLTYARSISDKEAHDELLAESDDEDGEDGRQRSAAAAAKKSSKSTVAQVLCLLLRVFVAPQLQKRYTRRSSLPAAVASP